jgi:hypothetical protein
VARRLAHLVCLALATTPLAVAPAAADTGIDDGMIPLPLGISELVPDPVHGTIWTHGIGGVQVVDVEEGTVREVEVGGTPEDLALDAAGEHAYITWSNKLSVVDTATLASRTIDVSGMTCAQEVAAGDGVVYLGDNCSYARTIDLDTGEVRASPATGRPISVPGRPRVLFWDNQRLAVVDTTTNEVIAERDLPPPIHVPAISSDGTKLLLAGDDEVHVRDLDTLTAVASVLVDRPGSTTLPDVDATTDDLLVGGQGLQVLDLDSGHLMNRMKPWHAEYWVTGGVATLGDTVVVTGRALDGGWALFLEDQPRIASADLTLDDVRPRDAFTPARVTGRLTEGDEPLAGRSIILTRDDGSLLDTVETDASGAFATTATFPESALLTARWAGDGDGPPAVAYASASVFAADTVLTVDSPAEVDPEDPLPVNVLLRTAGGAAVPGHDVELYRHCEGGYGWWDPIATLETGPDGRATYVGEPPACLEPEFLAVHRRTEQTKESSAEDSTVVTWGSSVIETSAPGDVVVGDTGTLGARLLVRRAPAEGRTLTLSSSDGGTWTRTTDTDGRASVEVDFPASATLTWHFAGESGVLPATAEQVVQTRRLSTVLDATTTIESIPVTGSIPVSATLLDEDGEPVSGAEVRLGGVEGEVLGVTDAAGAIDAEVTPEAWDPSHRVRLVYAGADRHAPSADQLFVDVRPLAASVTLTADREEVSADHEVVLSGTVATADPVDAGGLDLQVARIEPGTSGTALPPVPVAGDGSFSFTDAPPSSGTVTYVVTRPADARYDAVEAEETVTVVQQLPVQISLSTDEDRYVAGDRAVVTVVGDRDTGGEVTLAADPADGPPTVLYEGALTPTGLTAEVRLLTNTTLTATLAETLDRGGDAVSVERKVRLRMRSSLKGSWGRRDGLWLVAPKVRPRVVTDVLPLREGTCVDFDLQQRRRNGTWTPPTIDRCRDTGTDGRAVFKPGRHPLGTTWRARPSRSGDALNASSSGQYVVFTVRRRP